LTALAAPQTQPWHPVSVCGRRDQRAPWRATFALPYDMPDIVLTTNMTQKASSI